MRQEKKIRRRLMPLLLLTMLLSVLFGMNAMAASKTVTMKKSSGAYVYQQNRGYTGTIYHKITVPTSGVLAVSGNKVYSWGRGSMDVTVCNSKKKALTYRESVNASGDRYLTYGIQKGTYYLKTSGNGSYILAAGFQKMADRGAASKSKAYAISQKKIITGVIPIGESSNKADWFKIKIGRNKKLYVDIDSKCSGKIRFQLYGPSARKGCTIATLANSEGTYYIGNARTRKPIGLKAGTYYIKVSRAAKSATGVYSFRCKLK